MKIALSILALFAASQAFASGTSIGNGRVNCREGAIDSFWVQENEAGGAYERYTCRRGQWVSLMAEPQKPVRAAGCREGQIEHFPDNSVERGDPQESTFVCRDGQFVPLNRR